MADGGWIEPQFGDRGTAQVRQEHIGRGDEPFECFATLRISQVEADTAFVAVGELIDPRPVLNVSLRRGRHRPEGTEMPLGITLEGLNFDHISAHVTQDCPGAGAGMPNADFNDSNTTQWSHEFEYAAAESVHPSGLTIGGSATWVNLNWPSDRCWQFTPRPKLTVMNTTPLDRMTAAAALLREVEADNARLEDLLSQWAAMDHKRAELQAYYTSVWVDDRDQVETDDSDIRYAMGEDPIFDAISVRDEAVRNLIKELSRTLGED